MSLETRSALEVAEELLARRNFRDAVQQFQVHLKDNPNDLKALLKLGICHLLVGAEKVFRKIHDRAARLIEGLTHVPPDVVRLWKQYRSLFAKVTAAALVIGATAVSVSAAENNNRISGHRYSGGVAVNEISVETTVRVDKQGQMFLANQLLTAASLQKRIGSDARLRNGRIAIQPEGEAPLTRVGAVLAVCRAAGVKRVSIGRVLAEPIPSTVKPGENELRVYVSEAGKILVNEKTCTPQQLTAIIAERSKPSAVSVSVQAHGLARYQHVAPVLDACVAAKVNQVGFVIAKSVKGKPKGRPVTSSHRYSGGVFKKAEPVVPKR
ncbi:MAG: biopolymer transporter ExbD [Planctomycetes bacterium]|nr:biopolymer transporter ExbD [Planctomycetota bacterium]